MDNSNYKKQKFDRSSGIGFIKPLLRVARCMGIILSYDLANGLQQKSVYQKFYNFSMLAMTILMSSWSLYGNWEYIYPSTAEKSINVIDFANGAIVLSFNVISTVSLTFLKATSIEKLLQKFLQIDRDLNIGQDSIKYFYGDNFAMFLFMIVLFVYDGYVQTITNNLDFIKYVFFRYYQYLEILVIVLIFQNYVQCVNNRFRRMNFQLEQLFSNKRNATVSQAEEMRMNSSSYLRYLSKIYDSLCDAVDLINTVFGLQMMFVIATIIASTIRTLTISLKIALKSSITSKESLNKIDNSQVIAVNIAWSTMLLMMGIIICASCSMVVSNAEECGKLSHKLMLELPVNPISSKEQELKDELYLFSRYVKHRQPQFSAAGFFQINYTLIFTIVGAVVTYLIVILQLS